MTVTLAGGHALQLTLRAGCLLQGTEIAGQELANKCRGVGAWEGPRGHLEYATDLLSVREHLYHDPRLSRRRAITPWLKAFSGSPVSSGSTPDSQPGPRSPSMEPVPGQALPPGLLSPLRHLS